MEKTIGIKEASLIVDKTIKCLQLWDKSGKLPAFRTKTNRRYYLESQLSEFLNMKHIQKEKQDIIVYCRVSSQNQKPDLKNQRKILEEYCITKGYSNVEFVEEIGGGLNFNRKEFNNIINKIIQRKICKLIIAHKDRMCRFGFDIIKNLCKTHGCEIEILNSDNLSPEEEMVQDLMTIIHCFSSRLYGLRNYRKSLKKHLCK
jgi:putative resolvase